MESKREEQLISTILYHINTPIKSIDRATGILSYMREELKVEEILNGKQLPTAQSEEEVLKSLLTLTQLCEELT